MNIGAAQESLTLQVIEAIQGGNAQTLVSTPAWQTKQASIEEVLGDQFASADDTLLARVIGLWSLGLDSIDPAIRMSAMAMLADFANSFGLQHAEAFASATAEAEAPL